MPQCPKCGALLSKLRPHSKEWYCADCGFEGEEVHDPNMGCWYHLSGMRETATCPLEGRVVALEAKQKQEHAQHLTDTLHIERQDKEVAELEARLHALEQQHAELGRLHDEHVLLVHEQPLERPAAPAPEDIPFSAARVMPAPAQRQPGVYPFCHQCVHFEVDMGKPPCVDCKQHWQPRRGAV